jgi:uncharacterized protein (TIGR03435 family)
MQELDDIALLREYAGRDSEEAFATLVTRHIDRVYSVALRHTRNPHQAEEITQAVFVILARKSKHLRPGVILEGWLYQTARLTALTHIRSEIRRARREQEACMTKILNETDPEAWAQIAPLLDAALAGLNETDRNAVVLRFFYGRSLGEIGTALGASEDTARMRVNRALEKLRKYFTKRGVSSTAETIAGAISVNSVQAAPGALAKAVTAVALAKGATASASTLTLIKGALKIMAWSKVKTAIVAGVAILLAAGTTTVTVKEIQWHRIDDSLWDKGQANGSILDTAPHIVRIIPTKFPNGGGWVAAPNWKVLGVAGSLRELADVAYKGRFSRTLFPESLPSDRYDFIANLPAGNEAALQSELRKRFGIVAHRETVTTNVLFLRVKNPNAPGLKPSASQGNGSSVSFSEGHLKAANMQMASLVNDLEGQLGTPFVDQTGLKRKFDMDLTWDIQNDSQHEKFKQAVADQLGLEIIPGTAPLEFLVVEKAN